MKTDVTISAEIMADESLGDVCGLAEVHFLPPLRGCVRGGWARGSGIDSGGVGVPTRPVPSSPQDQMHGVVHSGARREESDMRNHPSECRREVMPGVLAEGVGMPPLVQAGQALLSNIGVGGSQQGEVAGHHQEGLTPQGLVAPEQLPAEGHQGHEDAIMQDVSQRPVMGMVNEPQQNDPPPFQGGLGQRQDGGSSRLRGELRDEEGSGQLTRSMGEHRNEASAPDGQLSCPLQQGGGGQQDRVTRGENPSGLQVEVKTQGVADSCSQQLVCSPRQSAQPSAACLVVTSLPAVPMVEASLLSVTAQHPAPIGPSRPSHLSVIHSTASISISRVNIEACHSLTFQGTAGGWLMDEAGPSSRVPAGGWLIEEPVTREGILQPPVQEGDVVRENDPPLQEDKTDCPLLKAAAGLLRGDMCDGRRLQEEFGEGPSNKKCSCSRKSARKGKSQGKAEFSRKGKQLMAQGSATSEEDEPPKVTRSVRQGCPLSPALYILYVEHLHEMIRADDRIVGFELPGGGQVKSNTFVDDTTAVSRVTQQSILALRDEIALFEKYAGARINWGKSVVVVPVGVDGAVFEGMRTQSPGDQFLYLGILVPAALSSGQQLEDLLHQAVVRMVAWAKKASHGVFGKVLIANNVVSATLCYAGAVSDPPKRAWRDYKRALRKFLWKDDLCVPHLIYRVRWEKLVQPRSAGGLVLFDPRIQLSALQMRTVLWFLLEDDTEPWKFITLREMVEAIRVHPADVETALLHPQLLQGLRWGALWSGVLQKWRGTVSYTNRASPLCGRTARALLGSSGWYVVFIGLLIYGTCKGARGGKKMRFCVNWSINRRRRKG
ncbi:hypothetical protein CBR_g27908 [Chara braunii]|uniref:Reverse transcriptase domain-containing protein n=1 Tax=Chara braunii TaxID=69332 RepID=A0A388L8S3_CHABU|nr:hypothetical protein CBR_g27908 [Chara braunii]|eukprot:GBG78684.1 hypothetical protein CBR_g27908 [Chara braunii]